LVGIGVCHTQKKKNQLKHLSDVFYVFGWNWGLPQTEKNISTLKTSFCCQPDLTSVFGWNWNLPQTEEKNQLKHLSVSNLT